MNVSQHNLERVQALRVRGVIVPQPESVYVAPDVDLERIAAGAVIYPGSRLYGVETWIGPEARVGEEGPATVENCAVGAGAALKGGSFRGSTFLAGASLGGGAQVREGCLLEEEASGAHTVGLKHTILFPFVTLGSLINFCDCLMAGGTSRKNHSEVGSAYIHFNYTPHQDKATASRFGDVPGGVMLDQPPVFLGGQGGAVGPLHLGFGTVVPAGIVVRRDCVVGRAVVPFEPPPDVTGFQPGLYRNIRRVVIHNLDYIGGLVALRRWYDTVRSPFFAAAAAPLFEHALATLEAAREERIKRFAALLDGLERSIDRGMSVDAPTAELLRQQELYVNRRAIADILREKPAGDTAAQDREILLPSVDAGRSKHGDNYIQVVRHLAAADRAAGTRWLQAVVEATRDSVLRTLQTFADEDA